MALVAFWEFVAQGPDVAIKLVNPCIHHVQCGHERRGAATENAHVPRKVTSSLGTQDPELRRAAAPDAAWLAVRAAYAALAVQLGSAMFCHRCWCGDPRAGVHSLLVTVGGACCAGR